MRRTSYATWQNLCQGLVDRAIFLFGASSFHFVATLGAVDRVGWGSQRRGKTCSLGTKRGSVRDGTNAVVLYLCLCVVETSTPSKTLKHSSVFHKLFSCGGMSYHFRKQLKSWTMTRTLRYTLRTLGGQIWCSTFWRFHEKSALTTWGEASVGQSFSCLRRIRTPYE